MKKKYRVLISPSKSGLEAEAEKLMSMDWKLQGGVSISNGPGPGVTYAQAMTKEEE